MNPAQEWNQIETRRRFFARGKNALGYAALSSLIGDAAAARSTSGPHFAPKAKRVLGFVLLFFHFIPSSGKLLFFQKVFSYYPTKCPAFILDLFFNLFDCL